MPIQITYFYCYVDENFQNRSYTILYLTTIIDGIYNIDITSIKNGLTEILVYLPKDKNATAAFNDSICLNYSEITDNQQYLLTFFYDNNTNLQTYTLDFRIEFGWYDVQQWYLFCRQRTASMDISGLTILSSGIGYLRVASDYYDEKYKAFDVFFVNFSDTQTLLCIIFDGNWLCFK